jgi:cytochrome c oxidase subunit 2
MLDRWLPPIASEHGPQIDNSLVWVHWLMAVLFVGWILFFFYCLWRFRRSRQPVADPVGAKSHASSWLEGGVALAEGVLLVGLAVPLWAARVAEFPPEKDSVVVRLVAEQFAWNVHYPGPDGTFGKTAIEKIDLQSNPLGIDRSDPAAKDDVTTVNQLRLPVGKPAIVHLSAKDVIHSFGIPEFRIKQDAVPGLDIPVWWVPTITTAQMREQLGKPEFVYEIACAQLCGIGHARMRGFVTIEEPAAFQQWLEAEVAAAQATEDDIWN